MSFDPGSGGGGNSISGGSDVVLSNPVTNEVLTYDSGVQKWKNQTAQGGDPVLGGDLTGTAANAQITAGAITNADISASAAIAQSKITNLTADLAGKAAATHTHAAGDITSGTIAAARLGSGTADGSTYLRGDGAWATPPTGGGAVDSVNGQTGVVVLDADDVGLGNVNNTSDANKPVSSATQTALNAKANASETVNLTGNQTVAGIKTFSSAPAVPDAAFTQAKVSGLTTALAGKVGSVNGVTGIWRGTQAEYNNLSSYDANVLYLVTGA